MTKQDGLQDALDAVLLKGAQRALARGDKDSAAAALAATSEKTRQELIKKGGKS